MSLSGSIDLPPAVIGVPTFAMLENVCTAGGEGERPDALCQSLVPLGITRSQPVSPMLRRIASPGGKKGLREDLGHTMSRALAYPLHLSIHSNRL